jgi:ATP-dependent DNA ligase
MTDPIYLQKALKFNPEKHKVDGWIAQPKYDGVRIQVCFTDDDPRIFSRSVVKKTGTFNEYTDKLEHIVYELCDLNWESDLCLNNQIIDGEAIAFNQGDREQNFKYVTGTLNCDEEKCLARQAENERISAVFYNLPNVPAEYSRVLEALHEIFDRYTKDELQFISATEYTVCEEGSHMIEFQKQIDAGGEGLILYNPDGRYKHSPDRCQTSKDLLKMKDINEREVAVVGMIEGTGKAAGMLGAFICQDYRGKEFNIGTGLTDADRIDFWNRREETPFIIEMMYHSETEDAYRLPVYLRDRSRDKTMDDWNRRD